MLPAAGGDDRPPTPTTGFADDANHVGGARQRPAWAAWLRAKDPAGRTT